MQLGQLLSTLSYGELNNLILDEGALGSLPAAMESKVVAYLNAGLSEIYARLPLLEKEVIIEAQDEIYIYYLQTKYAVEDPTPMPVGMKYIQDTADDPFLADVIRVSAVYDELGELVPLNENEVEGSFFTPKFDALQIPEPVTGNTYTVLYQANHPKILVDEPLAEIMVPPYLEIGLRAYICAGIFGSMNGAEHLARSMEYTMRYQEVMGLARDMDLARTSAPASVLTKFDARGFV